MATPRKVSESEIKAAIAAIMKRKRPDIARLRLDERARLIALRGKLEKQLEPLFVEAGLNTAKINDILAKYQNEVGGVSEKEKAKHAKALAALNKDLRRGIENRRKALERLAFKPLISTPIPLWTAFDIYEDPGTIPFQSHMEASNNWIVTTFESGVSQTTDVLGDFVDYYFWFAWQNPSQDLAVLNAESDLILQGTLKAAGNCHFFFGGLGRVDLYAELISYTGIDPISGDTVFIKSVDALGDLFHCAPPQTVTISDTHHLVGPVFLVSGGGLVLFAVHFQVYYEVSDGLVSFDFESPGFIMCPNVQVNLFDLSSRATAGGNA